MQTTFNIFIPVRPVPASRPRVGKYGAYYTENYANFRDECKSFLSKFYVRELHRATTDIYKVEIEFICQSPKKKSNAYPRGDIDNFIKGPLDVLTHCGFFWEDDVQITEIKATKRYAEGNEQYGIKIKVIPL